ncbi:hypothetical protein SAMN04515665_103138 [Blastococcus sp. DSM 46786]|uniref:GPW/gp25 family protein n=1 Tax=Blastococcus sp. DSM 46786 TaxID=1798227 RepID=UPI0008D43C63|nr:GPW/gp25 family protein [Blastococcus sp. DSM 46786]SEK59747.1 hypothetical protein SAMN04515665_103138 [Blastococcus sp. DSM 46786]
MARRYIADPLRLGPTLARSGSSPRHEGIAETDDLERHVRDKILAILFTRPGERVMRPRFGAGVDAQVFDGMSPLVLPALEYRIREGLARVLADDVLLADVVVTAAEGEGTLLVTVDYALRADRVPRRLEVTA